MKNVSCELTVVSEEKNSALTLRPLRLRGESKLCIDFLCALCTYCFYVFKKLLCNPFAKAKR